MIPRLRIHARKVIGAIAMSGSLALASTASMADPPPINATMQKGIDAAQHRNFKLAISIFEAEAKRGNGVAYISLGVLYAHGAGAPPDYKLAASWYARAWKLGGEFEKAADDGFVGIAVATGHSAKEMRSFLDLLALARALPKSRRQPPPRDMLGEYLGRNAFDEMTDHAFENPLSPAD